MGGYTRWGARGWQVLLPEYPMESPPPPHGTAAKQPELDLAPAPAPAVLCSPCTLRPVVDINAQWPLLERNTGTFATVRLYDTASVLCFHCFRDQNTAFHCGPQVQFWAEAVRAKFPANGHLVALLAEPWFPAMLEADGSGASRWVGGGAPCARNVLLRLDAGIFSVSVLHATTFSQMGNGKWAMAPGTITQTNSTLQISRTHTDFFSIPAIRRQHSALSHQHVHRPVAKATANVRPGKFWRSSRSRLLKELTESFSVCARPGWSNPFQ